MEVVDLDILGCPFHGINTTVAGLIVERSTVACRVSAFDLAASWIGWVAKWIGRVEIAVVVDKAATSSSIGD